MRATTHFILIIGWKHITDHDLERYYLGMVRDEWELAAMEEHILACEPCAERADTSQDYVDAMRAAALDLFESALLNPIGEHPKPAIDDHLKTGQR